MKVGITDGGGSGGGETTSGTATAAAEFMAAFLSSQKQQQQQQEEEQKERSAALHEDYVHVFLNVPADTSGRRPHQALINFQTMMGASSGGGPPGGAIAGGNDTPTFRSMAACGFRAMLTFRSIPAACGFRDGCLSSFVSIRRPFGFTIAPPLPLVIAALPSVD
jgi:hypothetical protein